MGAVTHTAVPSLLLVRVRSLHQKAPKTVLLVVGSALRLNKRQLGVLDLPFDKNATACYDCVDSILIGARISLQPHHSMYYARYRLPLPWCSTPGVHPLCLVPFGLIYKTTTSCHLGGIGITTHLVRSSRRHRNYYPFGALISAPIHPCAIYTHPALALRFPAHR